ncbi:hypothetical protein N0B51_00490 [Tsuneonella sp. YG55]|uniref:Secreted protein n=1 Tax=Tsuneonella litorea TaxID=2976475 RepID=A0A9X3AK71_9SPHN|nr:hypothetical protein [Tsuneonella litorea]MCT2557448.1 hypothetical protein [Tsuneonella litorea]
MTFSLPTSIKPAAVVAALAYTALTFSAALAPAPAQAATGAAFYHAELAVPAAEARTIASGLLWNCADTACTANKGTSRPVIVCKRLAKEVGPISAFVANGKPIDGDDLARCNDQ